MNDFTQDTFLVVGNIASVFTLISFVLAYIWNKQSERKAKKDERERLGYLRKHLVPFETWRSRKPRWRKSDSYERLII